MGELRNKLVKYITEYLSTKVIFTLDVLFSLLASLCVLLGAGYFSTGTTYGGVFALKWLGLALVYTVLLFLTTKCYKIIIRHSTLKDMLIFLAVSLGKGILMGATYLIAGNASPTLWLMVLFDICLTAFFLIGIRVTMIVGFDIFKNKLKDRQNRLRILVYGTGDKSVSIITRLENSPHYRILGFLSQEKTKKKFKIAELPVYYFDTEEDFSTFVSDTGVGAILFASDSDVQKEHDKAVPICNSLGLKILLAPSIDELVDGQLVQPKVREVKIEDLLGREEIKISLDKIREDFQGKVVLVTGAAGSIGSELCRQLAAFDIKQLVLFDNGETPMHNLRLELEERFPDLDFVPIIGDTRSLPRLDYVFRKWHPQVVFHAAAYKHVPLMEDNPCEAVLVNVTGSRQIADKCIEYDVEKMVMISTDKAVNPTNIMGCSKRLAEIYVQALGLAIESGKHPGRTKFVTTRFGNVLGSNGSVIPRFRDQIEKGGPVTVTHPDITRFFMTIPEACRLVMEAAVMSSGNQIFVFDMGKSVKIDHLARRMIELAGLVPGKDIKIEYTGLRPGEKLYEEVLSNTENTDPTSHDRIRVAKVRSYDYEEACRVTDELEALSRAVDIPAMVKLMKKTVPEFISNNSRFCEYDVK